MAMCVGDIFGYQNRSVYIISRQKIQHREKKTRRKRKNTWNCRENCYLCSTSYRAVIPPARRRNNKAAPVTTTTTTLTKKVAKKWGYTTRCIYVQCFMYIRHTYTISPQCMLFWSFYARATIYFGILKNETSACTPPILFSILKAFDGKEIFACLLSTVVFFLRKKLISFFFFVLSAHEFYDNFLPSHFVYRIKKYFCLEKSQSQSC